tara:strand:+ start:419 stop:628 length:210 start_codon:yes stop_codon:yes gene_type:complete
MKVKPKREYEVFNMTERRWEKRTMSEDQYQELLKVEKSNAEVLNAEYEIVSKIVSQNLGLPQSDKKSMD